MSLLYDVATVFWTVLAGACLAIAFGNAIEAEIEVWRLQQVGRNGVLLADAKWCRGEHRALLALLVLNLGVATVNWIFADATAPALFARPFAGIVTTLGLLYLSFSQSRRRQAFSRALRLGHQGNNPREVGPYGKEVTPHGTAGPGVQGTVAEREADPSEPRSGDLSGVEASPSGVGRPDHEREGSG